MLPEKAFIVDTETTGLDFHTDQVVELARLELPDTPAEFLKMPLDGDNLPMFHELYGHTKPMALGAVVTTLINPEKLVGLPLFKAVDYVGRYIIGHNVEFDARMTNCVGARQIDTMYLSRRLWPELDSHTQGAVLVHIALLTGRGYAWALDLIRGAHRADCDVLNCARILKYIIWTIDKEHPVKGKLTWEDLHRITDDSRVPTIMSFGKFKGQPVTAVEAGWAEWYAGTDNTDPYVIIALKRAGVLPA